MPIYQYECEKCKTQFEDWNSVDERHKAKCPECGEEGKIIPSGGNFKLIGEWHKTTGTY